MTSHRVSTATLSLAAILLLTGPAAGGARPDEPARLTLDILFGDDPGGRTASRIQWSPDGRTLSYVWDDGDGTALWALDPATGEVRALWRQAKAPEGEEEQEDELQGESAEPTLSLGAYHWSPTGRQILIESNGDLAMLDLDDLEVHRFDETADDEENPQFSPDGKMVAFARDYDLFAIDMATGEERELTTGGTENEVLNGITDWVYWEEIWGRRTRGFWWSPDSARIAYYRFDESPVKSYPLVDFTGVPYPELKWQRYPKAGEANPLVRVGVLDLATGGTVWLDTGAETDVYLARVDWLPSGKQLAVQRLNRDQNRLDVLLCEASDGACSVRLTEETKTWINLTDHLTFLDDGRFLWSSEKSGWRRLYLHAPDGKELFALSPEGWAVTSLDAVNGEQGWVVFTAYSRGTLGAKDRLVFRSPLAVDSWDPATSAEGWHSATVAEKTGYWAHRWSHANQPGRTVVREASGKAVAELPWAPPEGYDPATLPAWTFLTLPGPEGTELPAALMLPEGLDPAKKYPVIMYHYGGPGSQVVANRWSGRGRGLWHPLMAQRGFAVLRVDNLGSSFFGKAGEDRLHRRFGEVNLAAQLAGVEWLKSQGWADTDRIGLWGWSGGGSNTLYSVLNSPGTWRAAVAGAPVTDWRLYDTIWTERYLDHPADNEDGYRDSSAVTHAESLQDHLLIVHGTGDDNVHPQNTFAMLDRLIAAGAPVESAIYPRQTHGFRGPAARHFYERMTRFFVNYLGPQPEPPD